MIPEELLYSKESLMITELQLKQAQDLANKLELNPRDGQSIIDLARLISDNHFLYLKLTTTDDEPGCCHGNHESNDNVNLTIKE